MDYCIYCKQTGPFNNREHIIPESLGTFEPLNPTLIAEDKLVCHDCNSKTFSALETEFKEDSWEGITAQMINLTNNASVRIRGVNVKMKCLSPFNVDFFNDIFPFLGVQDGELVVLFKPQIKIKNYTNQEGFQVYLLEQLQKFNPRLSRYKKIKSRFANVKSKDVAFFAGANSPEDNLQSNKIIELLKALHVDYQERNKRFAYFGDQTGVYDVSMRCEITTNICRVIAKIAFNYFAFCALQDNQTSILHDPIFNDLKKFVLGDPIIDKGSVVIQVSDDSITYHEKESGNRFIGHTIVFLQEKGFIYARLSFFGGKVYKVLIGKTPTVLATDNFGCGYLFYPFDKSIHNLTQ